jgi:alcohol dehydrogenase YqhD (iron-dependent ADH family)
MEFVLANPIRIIFGAGEFDKLGEEAARHARHAMIVTGQSSARRLGYTEQSCPIARCCRGQVDRI